MRPWFAILMTVAACGDGGTRHSPDAQRPRDGGADAGHSDDEGDAGDSGTPAPPEVQSGSRVRQHWIGSGRRIEYGYRDRAAGLDCDYQRAADGRQRCMPHYAVMGREAYRDAECKERAYRHVPTACGGPLPARVRHTDDEAMRVFAVGARLTEAYERNGDRCERITLTESNQAYAVEEVPPTEFVASTREVVGSGRLREVFLRGDDGSRVRDRLYDAELDTDCYFNWSALRSACSPTDSVWADTAYTDDACGLRSDGIESSQIIGNPRFAIVADRCGPARAHRIASTRAPEVHYEKESITGDCERNDPHPTEQAFTLGPEVDLIEGTSSIDADGAVGQRVYTAGGVRAYTGPWDPARDIPCSPATAADGSQRCVGSLYETVFTYYADAECKQPLLVARSPKWLCDERIQNRYATRYEQIGCESRVHQYRLGARLDAPKAWEKSGDRCSPVTFSEHEAYYAVEAEEAPAELPAVEIVTD